MTALSVSIVGTLVGVPLLVLLSLIANTTQQIYLLLLERRDGP